MDPIFKSFTGIQLKEDKPGAFTAVIARLNAIDHDSDVTVPGAFPSGKSVVISAYMHGSWGGALPVGRATLREDGDNVLAEGEFNLNTASGRETYEAVKFTAELQEWSYGFRATEYDFGEQDGKEVRFLRKVEPFEISPVLKGAGIDTRTLAIKSQDGLAFTDEADMVLAAITRFATRCKSLADLRKKEGRELSAANRERIDNLMKALESLLPELKGVTAAPVDPAEAQKVYLEFLKIKMEA